VTAVARTHYAKAGEAEIAYQELGDGGADLLLLTGGTVPIDYVDEEASLARFHRRLASFSRLLRFDRRGMGLSDRGSPANPPTLEDWVEDAVAVLDAARSERAFVIAPLTSALEGLMLAAARPDRVHGLIVINGAARVSWAPDYPQGAGKDLVEAALQLGADPDAVDQGFDSLALFAPSKADDDTFRAWWDRAGNLGATPAMARAMQPRFYAGDVRHLLPSIEVPVLIIQRTGNPLLIAAHGRYLRERINGATLVELAGADLLYWVGDTGAMLDEIEEFVTGSRGGTGAERVLATVLFTDIVGSTERAGRLGDDRWRDLLDRHDLTVRTQLERFRGREVKVTGDGFVATFDSPGRSIECALAIRDSLAALDIDVRAGIHTGEIEVRGDDVAGMAVHIGARVSARAGPGEVLVSSTVKDLVVGSTVRFADRGEYELKGVPGNWRLFAVDG
jgi:class 3 adenylate cyclase